MMRVVVNKSCQSTVSVCVVDENQAIRRSPQSLLLGSLDFFDQSTFFFRSIKMTNSIKIYQKIKKKRKKGMQLRTKQGVCTNQEKNLYKKLN